MKQKIFVTGAAGFIGYHLTRKLLLNGIEVVGYDNINDYYDPTLKTNRLLELGIRQQDVKEGILVHSATFPGFGFMKGDLTSGDLLDDVFREQAFTTVVNLAAQAGVRYSLQNPHSYMQSNMVGFLNILEACRHHHIRHLVYASSSSVYGLNTNMPFSVHDNVDHPISLYAASKKSNELMAHAYSYLYNIPTTGLRFFTVYGPWGRPDMALFLFTKAILKGEVITVYNHGRMQRDFTYIDDIVEGLIRVVDHPPAGNPQWDGNKPDPSGSLAPYKLYNIGNNNPVQLLDFIRAVEESTGKKAEMDLQPIQPGDVPETFADVRDLVKDLDYKPDTNIKEGIRMFVDWYRKYYKT